MGLSRPAGDLPPVSTAKQINLTESVNIRFIYGGEQASRKVRSTIADATPQPQRPALRLLPVERIGSCRADRRRGIAASDLGLQLTTVYIGRAPSERQWLVVGAVGGTVCAVRQRARSGLPVRDRLLAVRGITTKSAYKPIVVLCVLIIILGRNAVACRCSVPCQREILFQHLISVSSDSNVRPVAVKGLRSQRNVLPAVASPTRPFGVRPLSHLAFTTFLKLFRLP
jgi:hypothetical protein